MKEFKIAVLPVAVFLIAMFTSLACSNYNIPANNSACVSCHTDYEKLFLVHDPDTVFPEGGCGGTPDYYEPYKRVVLRGAGWEAFKASSHNAIGCTGCHGGIGTTDDKYKAHSGDWTPEPSAEYQKNCGACHSDVTQGFITSIHNGTGQKRKVAMRHGKNSHLEFEDLSEEHKAGYNKKCASCHGTCGNCHVVRPEAGGGGLANGHNFNSYESKNKELDMRNVCTKCHSSRGGHAFLGQHPDTEPDLHYEAGYTCMDCHSGMELHGDGEAVEQRYAYSKLPTCDRCHYELMPETAEDNRYHYMHLDDFSCYVCHSQDYNNCGQCHIGGEGAMVEHYQDFKLAINPIQNVKSGFDSEVTLVRRTLAWQENWKEYGVPEYENFDVFPTYNYTTPHNIQKWTTRTQVDNGNCMSNCHMKVTATDTINKEFYLFKSDLLDWEMTATGGMTMDDNIPASWYEN